MISCSFILGRSYACVYQPHCRDIVNLVKVEKQKKTASSCPRVQKVRHGTSALFNTLRDCHDPRKITACCSCFGSTTTFPSASDSTVESSSLIPWPAIAVPTKFMR